METLIRRIKLEVESGPEYYYGKPTGKTQWRADMIWESPDNNDLGGILGRSTYSAKGAVDNWKFRAELDGHTNIEVTEVHEK